MRSSWRPNLQLGAERGLEQSVLDLVVAEFSAFGCAPDADGGVLCARSRNSANRNRGREGGHRDRQRRAETSLRHRSGPSRACCTFANMPIAAYEFDATCSGES